MSGRVWHDSDKVSEYGWDNGGNLNKLLCTIKVLFCQRFFFSNGGFYLNSLSTYIEILPGKN